MYKLNKASMKLIKHFEGWRSKSYKDPAGIWTIGYGHTSAAGNPKVTRGMSITKAYGDQLLLRDLQQYAKVVDENVKVKLTENQFGALVSFCYNVGPSNFKKSSVLNRVNRKLFDQVPARLLLWNKATVNGRLKPLRGLTRRRRAEGRLFMGKGSLMSRNTAVVVTTGVVALSFWDKIQAFFMGLFS